MEQDTRIISTAEELKVVSDPFRLRIIGAYRESLEPLTVKGCADVLGEVPAKVHYHVKKLLAIDILELDHVEVVNGINAKYYKLQKQKIKLQLKETDDEGLATSLKHLNSLVISQLENFKIDFINMSRETFARKEKSPYETGWISSTHLYLSEAEFDELQAYIFNKVAKFDKRDDKKRRYVFMNGLSRKD